MATPPRDGWDGGDKWGRKRTEIARENGFESWAEWVEEKEADSRWSSVCGRRNRSDEPCGRPEAAGTGKERGACEDHGGKSPQGPAHPQYRHGGDVETTFPEGILQSAREFFGQDPQHTLRENKLVLIELRNTFLEEVEEASGPGFRKLMQVKFDQMRAADEVDEKREILQDMSRLVESGVEGDQARGRLVTILRELRKTADAERRLFVDMHEVVEKPKLITLVDQLGQVVDKAIESNLTEEKVREVMAEASDPDDFARRLKRPIYRDLYAGLGSVVGRRESDSRPSENGGPPAP